MAEFPPTANSVVADMDCTVHKKTCGDVGVKGYPTIKHGNPNDLQDYKGGRDLASLQEFARENLGPSCSPTNLDLCDAEQKAAIEKVMKMSDGRINGRIRKKEKTIAKAEADFKAAVEQLQKSHEAATKTKEDVIAKAKTSEYTIMKKVAASRKSAK